MLKSSVIQNADYTPSTHTTQMTSHWECPGLVKKCFIDHFSLLKDLAREAVVPGLALPRIRWRPDQEIHGKRCRTPLSDGDRLPNWPAAMGHDNKQIDVRVPGG